MDVLVNVTEQWKLGLRSSTFFINDQLFVVKCYIYNFADDNTIAEIEKDLVLLRELCVKTGICMQWFDDNSMKTNAPSFSS